MLCRMVKSYKYAYQHSIMVDYKIDVIFLSARELSIEKRVFKTHFQYSHKTKNLNSKHLHIITKEKNKHG